MAVSAPTTHTIPTTAKTPLTSNQKRGFIAAYGGWTLDGMARHSLDFWLTSEDLPEPSNRVTLDREGRIVVGTAAQLLRHEELTRDSFHRREHPLVADVSPTQLRIDHPAPGHRVGLRRHA